MIKKDELLKDLRNDMNFEEDIVKKLSEFYNTLNWRQSLDKQHHIVIEKGLTELKNDTEKHAKMLGDIIQYIEGAKKDGF